MMTSDKRFLKESVGSVMKLLFKRAKDQLSNDELAELACSGQLSGELTSLTITLNELGLQMAEVKSDADSFNNTELCHLFFNLSTQLSVLGALHSISNEAAVLLVTREKARLATEQSKLSGNKKPA